MHRRFLAGGLCAAVLVLGIPSAATADTGLVQTDRRGDAPAVADLTRAVWSTHEDLITATIHVRDLNAHSQVMVFYHDHGDNRLASFRAFRVHRKTRLLFGVSISLQDPSGSCSDGHAIWRPRKNIVTITISRKCWTWNGDAYVGGPTIGRAVSRIGQTNTLTYDSIGKAHFSPRTASD